MAIWYVTDNGNGNRNGTSLNNAWSSADFNSTSSWGVGKIFAGDTVYLAGTFQNKLTVQGSGSSVSNRITLRGYPGCQLLAVWGGTNSNIAVLSCSFSQTVSTSSAAYESIRIDGANGWLVEDNYFQSTWGSAFQGHFGTINNNNIFRCNTIIDCTGASYGASGEAVVLLYGDQNLAEYNKIYQGLDRFILIGSGSIIRNNYCGDTDAILYPSSSPYPNHTDDFQSYSDTTRKIGNYQTLYERNYSEHNLDSVGGNGHDVIMQYSTNQGKWFINRFNVVNTIASAWGLYSGLDSIYGYNVTAYQIYSQSLSSFNTAVIYQSQMTKSVWKNITFYECPRCRGTQGIIPTGSTGSPPISSSYSSIHGYNSTAAQVKLPSPSFPSNLPQVDPNMVNAASGDFRLQSSSILIGSGSWIASALNSSSNSTLLLVDDAFGIFDGWGISDIDSDYIKIGTGSYVRVSSIDYSTNTITLSSPRSWNVNDSIYVFGMEDVGALPYNYAFPLSITNTSNSSSLSATSTVSSSIRHVEFRVNGTLIGRTTGSNGNYSVPLTSSLNPNDVIEARAFSLWPSKTPTVSQFITILQSISPSPSFDFQTETRLRPSAPPSMGTETVNTTNVPTKQQVVKEEASYYDPFVIAIMEEIDMLQRMGKLTPQREMLLRDEIVARLLRRR